MGDIILDHFLNEQQRVERVKQEIQAALTKYNCEIVPLFHLSPQGIQGEVQIRALMKIVKP